ncbi:CRTAC1 family protein [Paludisphaera sp.]|uniref:CRTAC1 family protein n=1 Tax=Paludisphaera sp. TaxID=2017432 RepID=UPI00301D95EE
MAASPSRGKAATVPTFIPPAKAPAVTDRGMLRKTSILLVALAAAGCSRAPEGPAPVAASRAPATAGPKAPAPTPPAVRFVDVTAESGVDFVHFNGARGEKLLPETMGSGVAFLDYDGDGAPDLLFVNSAPWPGAPAPDPPPTQRLYRNDGRGKFRDVTREAGLDRTFYGQGVAVGDYDNDGDPDVYFTAVGRGYLFRNDGGKFVDVSEEANARGPTAWLSGAAFFDADNDGDLDLFLASYITWTPEIDKVQGFQIPGLGRAYGPPTAFNGSLCALLRNDGGRFTDVGEGSGVQVRTPDLRAPLGKSLGVAPFDVDGDGLVDVAVSNDTVQNFLFHNKGGGKFEEVALLSGVAFDQSGSPRGGMGCDWSYFLNDGRPALAIGNFSSEMTALYVAEQPAAMLFSDMASRYGLGAPTQPPLKFGLFFLDYDLDGWPDLLTANGHLEPDIARAQPGESHAQPAQLLWNTGRPGRELFVELGADAAGPDLFRPMVGRGSAFADIDGDGDLDVVLTANDGPARLLRNDGGDANRWIRLALSGDGVRSNRDAIGARVQVTAGGLTRRAQQFPARGYLSSAEPTLTFGLGRSETVDEVSITWPSGEVTRLEGLAAGRTYRVDEADGVR